MGGHTFQGVFETAHAAMLALIKEEEFVGGMHLLHLEVVHIIPTKDGKYSVAARWVK